MEKIISITFDSERNVLIGLGEKGSIYESMYYSNIGEYGIWLKEKDNN